ncbi:MAG: exodeoxyribonuclease VII small subunit [Rhodospirillaceae bacterium]|jgi:exodeoxyribonuclease VII small subunit|nr:exodeoxyribonuclease VII small subunit [Rhodospirillaceae bacterium]MBT3926774.1 exodeoxyribonuclease VII small subunit [Rhodospirillaceae bacterium]MBT5677097.1 exodeoxyribonuclease VII small subunit [Rhodospirillaceae bacterium]MBT5779777.1 exodeoxyribonuclease VII small subunit [Rhodospirillaceae bacterium]MBT7293612.1 exodeoxyribonuclease VII small subunit [Rhodospirillaceae bacterium]
MSKNDKSADLGKINFETALGELEDIVQKLESGDTSLEGSIDAYERGIALKKHCEGKLREAQLRVEKIDKDGTLSTEPLETE